MSKLVSTNPSKDYEVVGEIEVSSLEEIKAKVSKAHAAKQGWRDMGIDGRAKLLLNIYNKIEQNKDRIAQLESKEMGMPITQALEDVDFSLEYLNSYLENAKDYLKPEVTLETDTEIHQVFHEPYGLVACIVPWNFPIANFVWQCGQNLVAGNTVVFKHSEETPLSGQLIEEIVAKELPEGVFSEVYGDGVVGDLLTKQDVDFICFTGSTRTGMKINESAAGRLIPTSMELGGSAPGIIFGDTTVDDIVHTIFTARFSACGQMCDALKRLIVHESKFEEIIDKLSEVLKAKTIGEAEDDKTEIGPLVAKRQLDLLEEQVADALQKGAKVVVGGKRPEVLKGAYYEPTLLTGITKDMRVWAEEVFGPVLPIVAFKNEAEAIRMANDTSYGLGAYIFTKDKKRFMRMSEALESGMVSQNNLSYINTSNPFTGYKMSGGGAEHAKFGFEEITQLKVVAREK